MILGMMQPYFFPYLGYWQLMNAVDEYIIYDDVNYIKGGWINRNRIKINGEPAFLGFSVRNASQNRIINELDVLLTEKDRDALIRKVSNAYAKAPFKADVLDLLADTLQCGTVNLAEFLAYSNRKTADYLGIRTPIYSATKLRLDHTHTAQQRIMDICLARGCSGYINAIGGKELYDKEAFAQQGLSLAFLKMDPDIAYPQGKGEFIPGLSILDVMMYNDRDEFHPLLSRYSLE